MRDNSPSFIHLHIHTEYSLLDGAIRIDDLLRRTFELGMSSVAITDHGTMFGAVEFYRKAIKVGIKPIIGCEFYIAPRRLSAKTPLDNGELSHLVLLAENQMGYRNLCRMVSIAHLEGFYYKPRIDKEILKEYSKGLIALSGCLHGEIPRLILQGRMEEAYEAARMYVNIFGEGNFFLEVQDNGMEVQKKVNQGLLDMSKRLSIPLVATNNCHYLNRKDAHAHDVLFCIQTGMTVHDKHRLRLKTNQFYFKSKKEMEASFQSFQGAIDHSADIAGRCRIDLDFNTNDTPEFQTYFDPTPGAVVEGVMEKCGSPDYAAQIISFRRMRSRSVIRKAAKALGINHKEVDNFIKMIPDGINVNLEGTLSQAPKLKNLAEKRPKLKDLLAIAKVLEGLPICASSHPTGVVIANRPLMDYFPLTRGRKGELITQYDIQSIGKAEGSVSRSVLQNISTTTCVGKSKGVKNIV